MLQTVMIQNFAIIDQLTVPVAEGMTVLTGETGAGKSIIIDALSLLLGARASATMIRHDTHKALIQALFVVPETHPAYHLCVLQHGIEDAEHGLLLERELHSSGKSVAKINGKLTTVSVLKQVAEQLLDIHGQHEHQALLDETQHVRLLDHFGGPELTAVTAAYQEAYAVYQDSKHQLQRLMADEEQRAQRLEVLQHQIQELDAAAVDSDEEAVLEQSYRQLTNFQKIADALYSANRLLDGDDRTVVSLLHQAVQALEQAAPYDAAYQQLAQRLRDCYYQVEEVAKDSRADHARLHWDEQQLEQVSQRLDVLRQLKRKYGATLADVCAYHEQAKQEYQQLQQLVQHRLADEQRYHTARQQLATIGAQLSDRRQQAAERLTAAIHQQLADLYMEQVQFDVVFAQHASGKRTIRPNGLDDIAFYVRTNVGEPSKPLAKVASGGEVSRLMLALKVVFVQTEAITTIVFDEIDTGVSGRVAKAIAKKMQELSRTVQVLAISHLPQVAAIADHQWYIDKVVTDDERTKTRVSELTLAQRQRELAKMLVGDELNDVALRQARDLLAQRQSHD